VKIGVILLTVVKISVTSFLIYLSVAFLVGGIAILRQDKEDYKRKRFPRL
jgi:hypothetical protein